MDNKYQEAFKRMWKSLDKVSVYYQKSKYWFLFDAFYAYIRYGVTPNEYIGFCFFKLSRLERNRFYTARHQARYENKFNAPAMADKFNRKELTNVVFKDYIKRKWIYTASSSEEKIINFINSHEKIIIKPIGLSSGKGIFTVTGNKNQKYDYLLEKLQVSSLSGTELLIEEFIKQHPKMASLNSSSVNTIRIFTVRSKKDGVVDIISASIRVGGQGKDVDNYHAGGVGYPLDITTGVVKGAGADIVGGRHLYHPGTNIKVIGFEVPNWNKLLNIIPSLCDVVPDGRLIAWDIAVVLDNFELIEANYLGDPGFMQTPSLEGFKKQILKYL